MRYDYFIPMAPAFAAAGPFPWLSAAINRLKLVIHNITRMVSCEYLYMFIHEAVGVTNKSIFLSTDSLIYMDISR